ncbi:hypothetical protein H4R18_001060 [Coemansia javaensis]|uniref:Uncharacterized protein n=1 Tax=Coemansia javaensis TaxID=2761396 RepID=A0A9W8LLV8_9FUNG|nr:hypothetical protein H4R18_001060 [Coemansia javaensis]
MEADHTQLYADTDDAGVLRARLRDTTARLEAAARVGLELVEQNQAMQRRLERLEQDQDELRQRVGLAERDRRWMQEQSLRVDQLRASVGELAALAEGARAARAESSRHSAAVAASIDKLRQDLDALVQTVDQAALSRRWAAEIAGLQRALGDARDGTSALASRVDEVCERAERAEAQQRARQADAARQLAELGVWAAECDAAQAGARDQAEWACGQIRALDEALRSVVAEHSATLNDHEQALRTLADAQAQLADEGRWLAAAAAATVAAPPAALPQTPQTATTAQGRCRAARAHAPQMAGGDAQKRGTTTSAVVVAAAACAGECLDSVFASGSPLLSSPVSVAGELRQEGLLLGAQSPPGWAPLAAGPPRKAASVVAPARRRASRPRVSSFSQADEQRQQRRQRRRPQSPAAVAAFSAISAPSHVGVGWGNHWEARSRCLQFDIQQRLSISIGARPSPDDLAGAD